MFAYMFVRSTPSLSEYWQTRAFWDGLLRVLTTMKPVKSLHRNDEGSALIEAAVLVPMMFSLVFGVFEFSWYFYQQQLIETGVRDAARYLTRIQLTTSGATPCTQIDSTTGTLYKTYAQNIALYGTTGSGTQRVPGWTG